MKNESIFIKLNDLQLIDFYTFRMHIALFLENNLNFI
jgi:hypothetical protein